MCTENSVHLYTPGPRHPPVPASLFVDDTSDLIEARVTAAQKAQGEQVLRLDAYPQQQELWAAVDSHVARIQRDLDFIVEDLHAHPELAFEEVRSQQVLAKVLKDHGHHVELGVYGVSTAF